MDFEQFKEELAAKIKETLDSKYGMETSVDVRTVEKMNESYEAITVKPDGSNIGVNLNANELFKEYEQGTPITQAPINRALERIVQAFNDSDIHNKQGKNVILPKLTTHSFRHTFANILCEENVNLKVMQMLLGQSDISTTLDIYTRVNEEFMRREFSSKWR